jgi:hypothetical protein
MSRTSILILCTLAITPGLSAQEATAQLEPDHAYIWVSHGAPEATVLRELGITQWPDTVKHGEGVEWTGFQFENFYLELLWVVDEQLFQEKWVSWHAPHLERADWRTTGASPFGLAFHRADLEISELPAPFRVEGWWDEQGGYVSDASAQMPFLMVMGSRYSMPDPYWMTPEVRALATHALGIRRLTGWTLTTPHSLDDEALQLLAEQGALRIQSSSGHLLELTFDGARQGKSYDARPDLPLVVRY